MMTRSAGWKPDGTSPPVPSLLGLLITTVGGPYLLLAGTAPLLQDWIGRGRADGSPYRLYAVSNAGSLLALVAYPLGVEPALGVAAQTAMWSATYAAFAQIGRAHV